MFLYRIKNLVTEEELETYRNIALSSEWYDHEIDENGVVRKGGKEGKNYNLLVLPRHHRTSVQIASKYGFKPSHVAMIKSPPNSKTDLHVDNKLRHVNFTFPLFLDARDIWHQVDEETYEHTRYHYPCLINASVPHKASYHGDKDSYVLQISTTMSWTDTIHHLNKRQLIL